MTIVNLVTHYGSHLQKRNGQSGVFYYKIISWENDKAPFGERSKTAKRRCCSSSLQMHSPRPQVLSVYFHGHFMKNVANIHQPLAAAPTLSQRRPWTTPRGDFLVNTWIISYNAIRIHLTQIRYTAASCWREMKNEEFHSVTLWLIFFCTCVALLIPRPLVTIPFHRNKITCSHTSMICMELKVNPNLLNLKGSKAMN